MFTPVLLIVNPRVGESLQFVPCLAQSAQELSPILRLGEELVRARVAKPIPRERSGQARPLSPDQARVCLPPDPSGIDRKEPVLQCLRYQACRDDWLEPAC